MPRRAPGRSAQAAARARAPGRAVELEMLLGERDRELAEARAQRGATAAVLRAIGGSSSDLQIVLDTIVESAARLCDAADARLFRIEDDQFRSAAAHGGRATAAHE